MENTDINNKNEEVIKPKNVQKHKKEQCSNIIIK